jgi:hypothetical protein
LTRKNLNKDSPSRSSHHSHEDELVHWFNLSFCSLVILKQKILILFFPHFYGYLQLKTMPVLYHSHHFMLV